MGLFSLSDQEARQLTPPPWEVAAPKRRRRPRQGLDKNLMDASLARVLRRLRVDRRDILILLALAGLCAVAVLWRFQSNNWLDQLDEPPLSPQPSSAMGR